MKKLYFAIVALLLCAISASAANITSGTKLYLKPNANWKVDGARFAAYFFGDGEAWASMTTAAGETDIYEVIVPGSAKNFSNVIFCRMNPGNQTNGWSNKWNQTGDLTYDGTNNLFTITDGSWDAGTWSVYTPKVITADVPKFSVTSETFSEAFELTITAEAGATIYYSIDGTDPSLVYSEPITISETTTVKAYAKVDGKENSSIVSITYTKFYEIPAGKEFYLKPNANWLSDNAWFAAYFFGNGEAWVKATDTNSDGVYEYEVPTPGNFSNVIFVRMNPASTETNWDNKWSQTSDLTWNGTDNLYTLYADSWDSGEWSVYNETVTPEPEPSFNGGVEIYLEPSAQWLSDNAWFAIYVYGAQGNAWATMADLDENGIYEVEIPMGEWEGLIFCRMNPEFTEPGWNNGDEDETGEPKHVWGQTQNLFFDGINNQFVIRGWNHVSWTEYDESRVYKEIYVNDQIGWDLLSLYGYEVGIENSTDLLFYSWPGLTSYRTATYTDPDGTGNTYKVFKMVASSKMYNIIFNNGLEGEDTRQFDCSVENITADKYYFFRIWNEGTAEEPNYKSELLTSLMTSVDDVDIEDVNAPVEYFNLQGVRVANPENGLYIRRQGSKVEKVFLNK